VVILEEKYMAGLKLVSEQSLETEVAVEAVDIQTVEAMDIQTVEVEVEVMGILTVEVEVEVEVMGILTVEVEVMDIGELIRWGTMVVGQTVLVV
jgi:hypothetical protein